MSAFRPAVGRKVWFHPAELLRAELKVFDRTQPCDATILYAWNDTRVNLLVLGPTGLTQRLMSVTLLRPGETPSADALRFGYAEWMPMPCQSGQAAEPATLLTPAVIDRAVSSTHYFTAAQGLVGEMLDRVELDCPDAADRDIKALARLTFCVLVMRDGMTVTGESVFSGPDGFDAAIARRVARANAIAKAWPREASRLEGRPTMAAVA